MRTSEITPYRCDCGKLLDQATDPTGMNQPKPGSLSVCIECGTVLRFTDEGLRKITHEELMALEPDRKRLLLKMRRHIVSRNFP